jgi:disulfide bond formation protein DsbB
MLVPIVRQTLSVLTVAAQIFLLLNLIYFFFFPKAKASPWAGFLAKNVLASSFLVALVATAGSLFFSEAAGYEPCELCWFQRIFMYPQVFLFSLAWARKDNKIIDYGIALAGIGGLISLYHNYVYYTAKVADFCGLSVGASCAIRYFTQFGYVTIPLMALTAFILLIFLGFAAKRANP